ncbi:MAG: NAD(P)H-hydrate dehydratase [Firmicutes bacterium]|jgi:NAD(P)H-hydrate epimerase|nr:NAD(P)H-hydrate dehydratase [Bacillota bacterium]
MKLVTAAQMRAIDSWAIGEIGIPGSVLMENAGAAVVRAIAAVAGRTRGLRAAVLCGKGNNGGDGFVAARRLVNAGADVEVFIVGGEEGIAGDALVHMESLRKMTGTGLGWRSIREAPDDAVGGDLSGELASFDVIVDAMLGTGFSGEVREPVASAIRAVNRARGRGADRGRGPLVVAVDVPSGLDATSGRPARDCVIADCTVTFAYAKTGLVLFPGADFAGTVFVADIGIPRERGPALAVEVETVERTLVASWLGRRRRDTHKGTYGHVLVAAGSSGMTGAACLCAEAALRAGAGLVTLGVPESLAPAMESKLTEVMKVALPERPRAAKDGRGAGVTFSREAIPLVREFCRIASVLALGPGLSVDDEVREFVAGVLRGADIPAVVDADGLNCLAGSNVLGERRAPTIVTPHPGEMSRLTGVSTAEIQANRIEVARRFAAESGAVTVLKGARTVVSSPGGRVYINMTADAVMAAGGMGDVLTGAIAGLLAQGLDPLSAAVTGVYVHGLAGELAAREVGSAGVLAGEVSRRLPRVRSAVERAAVDESARGPDVFLQPLDTGAAFIHSYIAGSCIAGRD